MEKPVARHSSHSPSAGNFSSFLEKTLTLQQNQSHQINEGAHGEHFRPKISHKKFITYPLNPKISQGELGTSLSFVSGKKRPLAVAMRMPPCTSVIHRGGISPVSLFLHILIWCTVRYGLEITNAMFPVL